MSEPSLLETPQSVEDKIYKHFLRWLVTPQSQKASKKLPLNMEEYITHHKLQKSLINSFYFKDSFPDDMLEATILWAKSQTPGMVHTLYERFNSTKSNKDFQTFMDFININKSKSADSIGSNITNNIMVINPTKTQYEQIIQREARALTGATSDTQGSSEEVAA